MKKTLNMMLAMMAGAMAFTACSSDDILENIENNEVAEAPSLLKPMTFTAVQEGEGGTRTAIATDTDGKANGINWTAGDKISIFDGASENAGVQMFELATGEGTTSATFTGSAKEDAGTYYALYPYAVGETSRAVTQAEAEAAAGSVSYYLDYWKDSYEYCDEYEKDEFFDMYRVTDELDDAGVSEENKAIVYAYIKGENCTFPGVSLDGSSIKNVVIPAEQTATAGSADPTAMIMIAKGEEKDALEFKNVCAYVKVTPQFNCTAICLKSNGTENLAGKMTVNYNDGEPTTTVTANGTNTVYLVGDITASNAYYIAVRPEALESGFTIEFLTADKTTYYARSTSKTLALVRSNVKNLGEFATSGAWTTTYTVSGNDGNGHTWAMLSLGGIKIATSMANSDPVSYSNITSWGDGWVLPTVADFTDLYSKGLLDGHQGMAINLRGEGILKYVVNADLPVGGWYPTLWTSTTDKAVAYNYTGMVREINESYTNASAKNSAIYKYNN